MRVIGTAGHVDHGKSALVAALTGTHPDRLKEEQEREMTIDLGFAWMSLPASDALPGGEQVGIVDVPGHRDFIENMLAGVGGIDAVLFVVAADEGVMPQTREHLAILDLLQVEVGVIVLTKIDLVDDAEWLAMVEADVRAAVAGTVLADAPIVRVSSKTKTGLDALTRALVACLAQKPQRPDLGRPRLPVDRVFTMPGFGTVVTGTLVDGSLKLGEELEVLPSGVRGRVRGLQSHKRKEQAAVPGSRTAVNLSGVDVEQVQRGDVLALPGSYVPTRLIDVYFRLLPLVSGPLKHASEVKFFLGAAEILARVRLLGVEELAPGGEAWLQLELRDPAVTVRGDRYILRRPSPGETLGGGVVVDPHPKTRHRRFDAPTLAGLESLRSGAPADVLLQAFAGAGYAPIREVVQRSRLAGTVAQSALDDLVHSGQVIVLEPGEISPSADLLAVALPRWIADTQRAQSEVAQYHQANPLRRGIPREELKSRLKVASARQYNAALKRWAAEGVLEEAGAFVRRPGFEIRLTPQQQALARVLLAKFAQNPFTPPSVKEAQAEVGEDLFAALLDLGLLVAVSPEVAFRKEDYDRMVSMVQEHFAREDTLTVIQFRDRLNASRRYVLAFLEHLDSIGLTIRAEDVRKLRRSASGGS